MVIVSTIMVLIIGAMLVGADRDVGTAMRETEHSRKIIYGITQQRFLMVEYILHHHERAKVQWRASHESLARDFRSGIPGGSGEQVLVEVLRERHEEIGAAFSRLIENHESRSSTVDGIAASQELEARLVGRILDMSQANIDSTAQLEKLNQAGLDDARRRVRTLVVLALLFMGVLIVGSAILTLHHILNPIARLQRGINVIADGDLGFRTNIASGNEIGALSRAFDRMADGLERSRAKLEARTRQLVEANTELESFSDSVSHDLRGPLRSMDGFSLALLEDYASRLDDEGRDFLHRIRAASQRMGCLIDDLLGLSRLGRTELKLARVDLSGLAREIAASLPGASPGRTVQWQIDDGVQVRADKGLIRIAMQNLLDNAWKFTGKSPGATIRVGAVERDGEQVIFVADNGAGFDMAHADRLFGAFQRLHHARDFPGTGIGLAIVQRVIRRHNGRIWAEATEGKGATFFFTLGEADHDARG